MLKNNQTILDWLKNVAILLTAHPQQQKWWDAVLLSLENYPGPIVFSYDDIDVKPIPARILQRFTAISANGKRYGHARGENVCIRNGLRCIHRMRKPFVLKLGFDEPVWRWRNIAELYEVMEKGDFDAIDNWTRLIFGKTKKLYMAYELHDPADPDQVPDKPAEAHYRGICKEAKLNHFTNMNYEYWRSLLGVTHLQGEYAANLGKSNDYSWKIAEMWPRESTEKP